LSSATGRRPQLRQDERNVYHIPFHLGILLLVCILYLLEFREAWISSSVLPLVSGTNLATNSMVIKLAAENMKKVPAFNKGVNVSMKRFSIY
jgi:uncharacterized membrane protein YkgB